MTKQDKHELVDELAAVLEATPNFYILEMGGMSVAQANDFRRKLFKANMSIRMVRNTLSKKALDKRGIDHSGIDPALKQSSSLIFVGEDTKAPAKLLKDHLKPGVELPKLKGAFIAQSAFVGQDQLDVLVTLKSKDELLGELIGRLQSPMSNLIGALQSGGGTIHGLLKTLGEREQAA
jgi:large subunit ribosomal protein L10